MGHPQAGGEKQGGTAGRGKNAHDGDAVPEAAMCETCKEFPKMCNGSGMKLPELCVIIRIQQILTRDMTTLNKEPL